jgi:hypothetical protein
MVRVQKFLKLALAGFSLYSLVHVCFSRQTEEVNSVQATTRPVLLYDDAINIQGLEGLVKLGAAPRYILIYQNNCDPEAQKTGVIDPIKVAAEIIKIGGDIPEGWGVLDFESPFDDWISKGPDSPECKKAVESMVNAIKKIKIMFPKVKWTYYGLPGLLYYLGDYNWATAPEELKKKEIARQLAQYGPIMDECDWLSPCCYDTVGDGKGGIMPLPNQRISTRAWHAARTKMCVDYARSKARNCPVIPFVSPLYMPGGGSRVWSVMPKDVMVEDTIEPVLISGAAGVTIWTAGSYFIQLVTSANKAKDFTEGGGIETMIKHWSQDLKVAPEQLETASAEPILRKMIADAILEMARETVRVWDKVQSQSQMKVQ